MDLGLKSTKQWICELMLISCGWEVSLPDVGLSKSVRVASASLAYSQNGQYLLRERFVPPQNIFMVFFLNSLLTILWVMRVYIVWVKGIRVTLSFAGYSWLRHFQHVLLMWLSQVAPLASHVTRSTSWAIFTNLILNSLQMNPTKYKEIN